MINEITVCIDFLFIERYPMDYKPKENTYRVGFTDNKLSKDKFLKQCSIAFDKACSEITKKQKGESHE